MAIGLTLYGYIGTILNKSIGPENEIFFIDGDDILQTADLKQIIDRNVEGLTPISAKTLGSGDCIAYIHGNMENWYQTYIQGVTPQFFVTEEERDSQIIDGKSTLDEGEAIISKGLADRAFGSLSPIGETLTIGQGKLQIGLNDYKDKTYRIVGVYEPKNANDVTSRVYLPMVYNQDVCTASAFIKDGYRMVDIQKELDAVEWKKVYGGEPFKVTIFYKHNNDAGFWIMYTVISLFSLLIFITGLVNFMKFMVQMFYTRQRELALRKCVGSNNKGLYGLLASEVIVMLAVAFFLSCVTSEAVNSYIRVMEIEEFSGVRLGELIQMQLFATGAALVVSLFVILVPIWKLRRVGMKGSMMRKRQGKKARFAMLALQFAVSVVFFVFLGITLKTTSMESSRVGKTMSGEEMGRIMHLSASAKDWENIRPELEKLPVFDLFAYCSTENFTDNSLSFRSYILGKDTMEANILATGDPKYFEMFGIPMEGKVVSPEEDNYVYVDKVLHKLLQEQGDFDGTIKLDWGQTYQIAGVMDCDLSSKNTAYFNDGSTIKKLQGTIFNVSRSGGNYYYRIKDGVTLADARKSVEAVYRKYVPESVDVELPTLKDVVDVHDKPYKMIIHLMLLLTFISLLVMVLSVYSTISLDATTRQKEIAIRKINGARSRDIVMQFLRPYLLTYVITFLVVYLLMASVMLEVLIGDAQSIMLFPVSLRLLYGVAILIVTIGLLCLTTWTKIKMIMKVNPAEVVRRE